MLSKATTAFLVSGASFVTAACATSVWQPAVGTTWQIILSGTLNIDTSSPSVTPDVAVYDIDLFGNTNEGEDASKIAALHQLGKKVICYFSAGSYEPGRPDSSLFTSADKGNELDGWPGEYWLNLNSNNVRDIMAARIKTASDMGCDAIDPDNVDGYGENDGDNGSFTLTEADSIDYVKFLASEAQQYGMATGLKNAGEIINSVLSVVQFSVNEQCAEYSECSTFEAFTKAGKPVFHIEYPHGDDEDNTSTVSTVTKYCSISDFSTVLKDMDLDGWVEFCDKSTATTKVSN
ncbi:endo alpha-1,4 polygalactosaminidase precursor [Xylariales sp. PMI_506]|nr:endo alpha-1,4 polygalactosaminidase precursor [Xylariales sp. PMI_506]